MNVFRKMMFLFLMLTITQGTVVLNGMMVAEQPVDEVQVEEENLEITKEEELEQLQAKNKGILSVKMREDVAFDSTNESFDYKIAFKRIEAFKLVIARLKDSGKISLAHANQLHNELNQVSIERFINNCSTQEEMTIILEDVNTVKSLYTMLRVTLNAFNQCRQAEEKTEEINQKKDLLKNCLDLIVKKDVQLQKEIGFASLLLLATKNKHYKELAVVLNQINKLPTNEKRTYFNVVDQNNNTAFRFAKKNDDETAKRLLLTELRKIKKEEMQDVEKKLEELFNKKENEQPAVNIVAPEFTKEDLEIEIKQKFNMLFESAEDDIQAISEKIKQLKNAQQITSGEAIILDAEFDREINNQILTSNLILEYVHPSLKDEEAIEDCYNNQLEEFYDNLLAHENSVEKLYTLFRLTLTFLENANAQENQHVDEESHNLKLEYIKKMLAVIISRDYELQKENKFSTSLLHLITTHGNHNELEMIVNVIGSINLLSEKKRTYFDALNENGHSALDIAESNNNERAKQIFTSDLIKTYIDPSIDQMKNMDKIYENAQKAFLFDILQHKKSSKKLYRMLQMIFTFIESMPIDEDLSVIEDAKMKHFKKILTLIVCRDFQIQMKNGFKTTSILHLLTKNKQYAQLETALSMMNQEHFTFTNLMVKRPDFFKENFLHYPDEDGNSLLDRMEEKRKSDYLDAEDEIGNSALDIAEQGDYQQAINSLKKEGALSREQRRYLIVKALKWTGAFRYIKWGCSLFGVKIETSPQEDPVVSAEKYANKLQQEERDALEKKIRDQERSEQYARRLQQKEQEALDQQIRNEELNEQYIRKLQQEGKIQLVQQPQVQLPQNPQFQQTENLYPSVPVNHYHHVQPSAPEIEYFDEPSTSETHIPYIQPVFIPHGATINQDGDIVYEIK